jgi:uncharacterized protein (TIGR02466 family)
VIEIKIQNIFPTPLMLIENEKGITKEEKITIDKYKKNSYFDLSHTYTQDNQVLLNKGLKQLKHFIEFGIEAYVNNIICPKNKLNFYITESWINYNNYNDFTHPHTHPNSIISGVYYIDTLKDDLIQFLKPKDQIRIEPTNYNDYNSGSRQIPIKNNLLILFPSTLEHSVLHNKQIPHKQRISLSFNTFVKGKINKTFSTNLWLK